MLNTQMPLDVGRQFDSIFGAIESKKPKQTALNVEATFCQVNKTITLKDRNGSNGVVVLRGFQAENFKKSFMQMKKDCPNLSVPKAIAALAAPYVSHWLEI